MSISKIFYHYLYSFRNKFYRFPKFLFLLNFIIFILLNFDKFYPFYYLSLFLTKFQFVYHLKIIMIPHCFYFFHIFHILYFFKPYFNKLDFFIFFIMLRNFLFYKIYLLKLILNFTLFKLKIFIYY